MTAFMIYGSIDTHPHDLLRQIARDIPADRLLVETDAPSLAPAPIQDQRNEPAHIHHVVRLLAELRGVSVEDIERRTTENFYRASRKQDPVMKYRKLGNSDLMVSEIAFGSWLTTSGGVEKETAIACVHRALDCGITLIDTANVYGRGAAETVIGEALSGLPRESYVLATKLYFPMSDTDKGLSRGQVHKQIDASLARLKVDHVDLYQCHRYDADTPLEETMEALSEVVRAGKARYLGFSEWPVDRIEAALALPGVEKFVSSQPEYSLLHRKPEQAVIPLCARSGISQIVWSPLGQGVLTGKYTPGGAIPDDSRAAHDTMGNSFRRHWLAAPVLEAVQALKPLADQAGLTLAQFALAWVLREPNVAAAIIGASRPGQIDENVVASGHDVPAALFEQAERIIGPVA